MQKSYGQLKQDVLALDFFRSYQASERVFLDLGAFDGVSFSNTHLFFQTGWSGVCVEPCSKNFRKLEVLYKDTKVIPVQAAATDYIGELELNIATIPWAKDWGSDVSSPSQEAIERWPDYVWEKEVVPATTVNQILVSKQINKVDFVSIDVEGQEMAALRGFDLQKYQPHLIVVEYSDALERRDLLDYLRSQGYFLWSDNGQDLFVVRGSKLAHWKVLFKGWWHQPGNILDKLKTLIKRSR